VHGRREILHGEGRLEVNDFFAAFALGCSGRFRRCRRNLGRRGDRGLRRLGLENLRNRRERRERFVFQRGRRALAHGLLFRLDERNYLLGRLLCRRGRFGGSALRFFSGGGFRRGFGRGSGLGAGLGVGLGVVFFRAGFWGRLGGHQMILG